MKIAKKKKHLIFSEYGKKRQNCKSHISKPKTKYNMEINDSKTILEQLRENVLSNMKVTIQFTLSTTLHRIFWRLIFVKVTISTLE